MAITKYKVIKKNLEAVINYAMNGEKTENGILVSAINCLPETVYSQMILTKKVFHKEDGRLGYHIIQSFKENEISPEKCNKIGMELAQQLWGDKYQVLVCTHKNKQNIHNHIVLNSVSFIDGSKYHNSNVEIALLRETNDDKKVYKVKIYDGIKINQEKLRTSSFYRLYVHYLYLLGKLPPKIHYEERTIQYYQEIDKFNKLVDEMSLICTYNLNSKEDVQNLKIQYIEQVTPLKAEREKLRNLYKKATNETDKSFLEYKLNNITNDIDKINAKIQTCKRIIDTAEKGGREDNLIENRVSKNQISNEQERKKKDKKELDRATF